MTIVEQYESGLTIAEIGRLRGHPPSKIRRWLRGMGCKIRRAGRRKGLQNPELAAQVVEMRKQGHTFTTIADTLPVSKSYAKLRAKEAGLCGS